MSTFKEVVKTKAKHLLGKGSYRAFGQNGEDALIHALLRGIKKGTYVDVGAYNPILYSNTYGLYREGWSGVTIDPNPAMGAQHRILRPRDTFVLSGVSNKEAESDYYRFSDGAYNTFDPEVAAEFKARSYPRFIRKEKAHLSPLNVILSKHNITKVDFLDVDVEGLDVEVLESFDWKLAPRVVAIESRAFDPEHITADPAYIFLRKHGYVLAGFFKYTLIFAHQE